ncbi:MAG: hypothetical protein M0Z96_03470 [Actinomycetota bacterium]|nr:hypothetical protein [Actinomycetota bacterium]
MAQSTVACPICGGTILDYEKFWGCEAGDKCPENFKVYKTISGYALTAADLVDICNGAVTAEREFFSQAKNKAFPAKMAWDSKERKVRLRFANDELNEALKDVLCPDHNVPLRSSEKTFYCPTKLSNEEWCPVKAWRDCNGHALTPEELGQLLLGVELGPWVMTSRTKGTKYRATVEWDFDEHKIKYTFSNGKQDDPNPADEPPQGEPPAHGAPTAVAMAKTATTSGTTAAEVPKWVTVLPEKAAQVTRLLGLDDEDSELILEAAIAAVTGARGQSAKDITTSEVANAVRTELNQLAIGHLEPQAHFGDDGSECYVLVESAS